MPFYAPSATRSGSVAAVSALPVYPLYRAGMAAQMSLPSIQAPGGTYYTQHFGFFCKKELNFEKTTGYPPPVPAGLPGIRQSPRREIVRNAPSG